MSITIQQIADLFGDQDQDPSTPIFSGHKYEELQLQNLQLRQQVELLQSELKYQCAFSQNMCQSVIRLKNLLKHEMQKNKTLTDEYVKKSEECYKLRMDVPKRNLRLRLPTCPSECSTIANSIMLRHKTLDHI